VTGDDQYGESPLFAHMEAPDQLAKAILNFVDDAKAS
jgi:hypothetical protein